MNSFVVSIILYTHFFRIVMIFFLTPTEGRYGCIQDRHFPRQSRSFIRKTFENAQHARFLFKLFSVNTRN